MEFINSHAGRIASIHIKENGGVIGANKPQSRHDNTPRFKIEKDADGNPIFPPEFIKMKEEHDRLNVPQGTGIVDWKAVKAAADAQSAISQKTSDKKQTSKEGSNAEDEN